MRITKIARGSYVETLLAAFAAMALAFMASADTPIGGDAWDGDLSTLDRDVTIESDMTLYGELTRQCQISIADGVAVTLNGAIITNGENDASYSWAGITCLGDATINLVSGSENFVKGFYDEYPGIYVPANKTLTINGSGSLDVSSNGYGAGIGGIYGKDSDGTYKGVRCGNIVINGGVITAVGGGSAAGIGGAFWCDCGYITINSGTVKATAEYGGAGIGGGHEADCGNITIAAGITRVVATCGGDCDNAIGAGYNGECGEVTVDPSLTNEGDKPTRTITGGGASSGGYEAWAAANGVTDAWDAPGANGIANVFRYAFNKPTEAFTVIDIGFDANGKAVIITPSLLYGDGFTFMIEASDNVDGTGATESYELNASGRTTIDETGKPRRFFRLRVVEKN